MTSTRLWIVAGIGSLLLVGIGAYGWRTRVVCSRFCPTCASSEQWTNALGMRWQFQFEQDERLRQHLGRCTTHAWMTTSTANRGGKRYRTMAVGALTESRCLQILAAILDRPAAQQAGWFDVYRAAARSTPPNTAIDALAKALRDPSSVPPAAGP